MVPSGLFSDKLRKNREQFLYKSEYNSFHQFPLIETEFLVDSWSIQLHEYLI